MKNALEPIIQALLTIQERLLVNLPERERLFSEEEMLSKRAMMLIGPRGTGKSTFMLRLSKKLPGQTFYVSLDNPLMASLSLFELGDWVFQNGYDTLICDEVHYHPDWSVHLKALYDSHPRKKIWASDSSALVLRKGLGDLSRRFLVREFSYLSFREYLWLKHGVLLPGVSYEILLENRANINIKLENLNIQHEFQNYMKSGMRPFFLEDDYPERLQGIVDKIIHSDIPHFMPEIRETHLNLMRHVIGYLAMSPIPTLNIDSLSNAWAVSKLTVYHLLEMMENTGLINIVRHEGIKKGHSKGAKIFFSDPNLYAVLGGPVGNVREAFFVMQLRMTHKDPRCPKDDSQYDYSADSDTFEIGGRSKKKKQAKFVVRDDIDTPTNGVLPLWLIGFSIPRLNG